MTFKPEGMTKEGKERRWEGLTLLNGPPAVVLLSFLRRRTAHLASNLFILITGNEFTNSTDEHFFLDFLPYPPPLQLFHCRFPTNHLSTGNNLGNTDLIKKPDSLLLKVNHNHHQFSHNILQHSISAVHWLIAVGTVLHLLHLLIHRSLLSSMNGSLGSPGEGSGYKGWVEVGLDEWVKLVLHTGANNQMTPRLICQEESCTIETLQSFSYQITYIATITVIIEGNRTRVLLPLLMAANDCKLFSQQLWSRTMQSSMK